jgi:hypothetical protein
MLDGRAHGADAFAHNKEFSGLEERAVLDLQQARGVEHDGRGGLLGRRRVWENAGGK